MSAIKITKINLTKQTSFISSVKELYRRPLNWMKEVYERAPKWNEDQEARFEERDDTLQL